MFHSASENEYNERLDHYSKAWDPEFEEYFKKEIHPIVPFKVGRWLLEFYQLYNPYCGVTNNQAEGFNRVMKDFQQWKEAPLDSFVLALYQLQAFYYNEIQRDLAGRYVQKLHICGYNCKAYVYVYVLDICIYVSVCEH